MILGKLKPLIPCHDKLTFGMILAAAVSRKRKVNNKKIRDMKKLSNYPKKPIFLKTVRGFGYRFEDE